MSVITLSSTIRIDSQSVITVSDIRTKYLTGLVLPSTIDDSVLQHYIDVAISEVQNFLGLRLKRTIIKEDRSFYREDWINWGYMKTTYPCVAPVSLEGKLGNTKQITYPKAWLSVRQTTDDTNYSRSLSIVPSGSSSAVQIIGMLGTNLGYTINRYSDIPDYWSIEYITGWDNPPLEIINAIGMLVTANVLQIISDAIMSGSARQVIDSNGNAVLVQSGATGFGLGLSSKSISIDGLSQSTSTFVNGQTGLFGARLKQLLDNLNPATKGSLMNRLYDQYAAIVMGVA